MAKQSRNETRAAEPAAAPSPAVAPEPEAVAQPKVTQTLQGAESHNLVVTLSRLADKAQREGRPHEHVTLHTLAVRAGELLYAANAAAPHLDGDAAVVVNALRRNL